jgi:5'-3' exonuclease
MSVARRLVLLDTASLYVRAFHGVPGTVRDPQGNPVNAVRGLLDAIALVLRTRAPERMVACWDEDWRPAFRVAAVPGYKAHRLAVGPSGEPTGAEEMPEDLLPQVPRIVEVLRAVGIPRLGCPGYEADDVIATLTDRAVRGGLLVEVVTGDRDLFQLVDDAAGVRVLYAGRGLRRAEMVDQAWLSRRYGVRDGNGYADLAVLRGDPSDGLPGVPGIGERTAATLLSRFGTLRQVLAAARDGAPGLTSGTAARLVRAEPDIRAAERVVRLVRDAPVPEADDRVPWRDRAVPATGAAVAGGAGPGDLRPDLVELGRRWGLTGSLTRLAEVLGTPDRWPDPAPGASGRRSPG